MRDVLVLNNLRCQPLGASLLSFESSKNCTQTAFLRLPIDWDRFATRFQVVEFNVAVLPLEVEDS